MSTSRNWDSVASNYEQKVFNVFESDINGLLIDSIKKYGNKSKVAGDFGCGIGRGLPLLSDIFQEVYAWDFSPESIKLAAKSGLANVQYKTVDLTNSQIKLPKVDFGLCVNVAISDDIEKNYVIINKVISRLNKDGVALFVMPSWESVSMVSWRTMQIYGKEGISIHEIPDEFLEFYAGKKVDPKEGIFTVDEIPTKHWLISEFMTLFEKPNLLIEAIDKIEYDWTTELTQPPSWLGYPFPWDWMVIVRKIK